MMQLSLHESMKHNTTTKNEACEYRTSTEPPFQPPPIHDVDLIQDVF